MWDPGWRRQMLSYDWPVCIQGVGLVKGQLCVKESITHHVNHRNRRLAFESCSVGNVAAAALIKRSAWVFSVWRFLCSCFHSICWELNFKKRRSRDFSLCQWITSLLLKATTQHHKLLPVGNSKLMSANPQSLTWNQSWTSSQNEVGDCAGTFRFIMMFKHEAYRIIFPLWHKQTLWCLNIQENVLIQTQTENTHEARREGRFLPRKRPAEWLTCYITETSTASPKQTLSAHWWVASFPLMSSSSLNPFLLLSLLCLTSQLPFSFTFCNS